MKRRKQQYALKIGSGFYVADDRPLTRSISRAFKMPTRQAALTEADIVERLWGIESPLRVTVTTLQQLSEC